MLTCVVLTICLLGFGNSFPIQVRQFPAQNTPLSWIYPGLSNQYQQPQPFSYQRLQPLMYQQPMPYQQPAIYPIIIISPSKLGTTNDETNQNSKLSFRQSLPGTIISAIPFLPIEINLPDIITSILNGLQSVFGGNLPFFQQGVSPVSDTLITTLPSQDGMLPIGMNNKNIPFGQTMPMPIFVIIPVKEASTEEYSEKKL